MGLRQSRVARRGYSSSTDVLQINTHARSFYPSSTDPLQMFYRSICKSLISLGFLQVLYRSGLLHSFYSACTGFLHLEH